jgi:hypothetical protein
MAPLDSLPPDQRAVLQLVLQRGRSYDQIAKLLSIDRGSVRERAVSAFDALGPQTSVAAQRRGLIADYLLGQLDPEAATETRDGIADSPSERAWARVVASELAPLAAEPLPEIPSTRSAPAASAPDLPASPAPVPGSTEPLIEFPEDTPDTRSEPALPAAIPAAEDESADTPSGRSRRRGRRERKPKEPKAPVPAPEPKVPSVGDASGRRSSRLGGTVLIAITVLIVAVIAIILLSSGGSNPSTPAASASSTTPSTPAAASSTTAGSGTTSASGSGTTPAKVVAQINLTPTATGSKAAGIAEVLKEGATNGIAIVAQNVTPNTTKPPNAYAVWLYNSPTDAHLLGFVNPGVGANGRLSTAGGLPANAAHYKQLIVTLETKASPTTPGTIVLQGTLSGL